MKLNLSIFLDYGDGLPESFFILIENHHPCLVEYFADGTSIPRYWTYVDDKWQPFSGGPYGVVGSKLNREPGMTDKLIQSIYDKLFDIYAESEIL